MKHSLLAIVFLSTATLTSCGRSGFSGSSAKPAEIPNAPSTTHNKPGGAPGGVLPESKNDADGNPADDGKTGSGPTVPPPLPGTSKGGTTDPSKTPAKTDPATTGTAAPTGPAGPAAPTLPVTTLPGPVPVKVQVCSDFITVSGQANPWLAHAHDGAKLVYSNGVSDTAPQQAPIPHASVCVAKGKHLVFETNSDTNHVGKPVTHKGEGLETTVGFDLGAFRGFSNIVAPLDSLVAVFIPANHDVSGASPATLHFDSVAARNFTELQPRLGQIFFIGDGRTFDGAIQRFVVPEGAVKIVFGNMDGFQWSNNTGSHKVRVNEVLP